MDIGRVEYYLDMWRDYMKTNNSKLGYKSKSSGFHTGGVHSFDDIADEVDSHSVRVVEQVIDDLPIAQKSAVNIFWLGISTNMDIDELMKLYDSALVMLQKKLPAKNLY
jgi:hypothetical protein